MKEITAEGDHSYDERHHRHRPSVVACTCSLPALEAEFWNGVGSVPVGVNNSLIGGWIV